MKIKLLSVVAFSLALGLAALSPNANKATVVAHAEEATYVTVYQNPCDYINKGSAYDTVVNVGAVTYGSTSVNWSIQGYAKYDAGWRVGGKYQESAPSVDRIMKTTSPLASSVDRVEVSLSTGTMSAETYPVSLSVYSTYTDGVFSDQIGTTLEQEGTKNSTITFDRPDGVSWENAYYQFVFTLNFDTSETGNKYIHVSDYTFSQAAAGDLVELDSNTIDIVVNEEATLTATSASGNVTWTSEPSDVVSVTPSGELNDVATLVGLKEGTATITATVGTATATCIVNVSALTNNFVRVTNLSDLNVGDTIALVFEEAGVVAATFENSNEPKAIYPANLVNGMINEYLPLTIAEGYETGTYAFALEDGKYLRNTKAANNFYRNVNISDTTSWTISIDSETGKASIQNCNAENLKYICYRGSTYQYIRCQAEVVDGYELPVIYKYSEASSDAATTYANTFLSSTGTVCEATQTGAAGTAPAALTTVWAELKASYEALGSDDQDALTNAVANEAGSVLEQAAARYDYIMAKYTGLDNYMSRTTVSMTNLSLNIIDNSGANYIVILAAAIVLLGGCALVIKLKKKHN